MTDTTAEQDRIERDLEETRTRMDHRLEDLERHLSPGQIVDDVTSYLRGSGAGDFSRVLVESIKSNPLPVALTAVGLTWLIASKTGVGGQSVGEALGSVKQAATETAHDLRDQIGGSGTQTGGMGGALTSNPILLGALGLAAGASLAALLPPSAAEATAAGAAVDRALGAVRGLAREAIDRGSAVAHKMVDAGLASAEEHGLTGDKPVSEAVDDAVSGRLVEEVKDVARDAVEAGRDALKDDGARQETPIQGSKAGLDQAAGGKGV